MRLPLVNILSIAILLTACNTESKKENTKENKQSTAMNNPFLEKSKLDFQAPDFSKIKNKDFLPAIKEGISQEKTDIKAIIDNPDSATFDNTLVALQKSGSMLGRVTSVFYLLAGANTNDSIKETRKEVAPKLAGLRDFIFLNDQLFQRVKDIYEKREQLDLDKEDEKLVEYYYEIFVRAGAELSETDKDQLKKINLKMSSLTTEFSTQLLDGTKDGSYVTNDKSDLDGLSEDEMSSFAQGKNKDGKEEWIIPLDNTTQQTIFASLNNRSVRKQIFENSWNRTEKDDSNDTRKTIKKVAELRAQKATLLGFDNYATWKLQDQMAKTPQTVEDFLTQLVGPAKKKAKQETDALQQLMGKNNKDITIEPWDWNYYAEKLRKEKYDLNEEEIKPYFELNNVLEKGIFYAANQLYGITFKERKDLPVWQKDVRVFEVYDKDSSTIGLFYCDFYKRANKGGGAWMTNIVDQSKLLHTKPVIVNVCNFSKPNAGQPALLTWDNVTTMFHEFGHALHGFFADQKYSSLSGTAVARDFVEMPSQFNEHWASNSKVFENYAIHYKTGNKMPKDLVEKIKKSVTFNQGYRLTELLEAAQLDMQWHTISPDKKINNVDSFEVQALKNVKLYLKTIPPRYRSTYFKHIWSNGYSAGYYAYLWTEMLDDNIFDWFKSHGGLTAENGQRFRDMILSRGNTEDYDKMFFDFVGHEPNIQPMLEDRGLVK